MPRHLTPLVFAAVAFGTAPSARAGGSGWGLDSMMDTIDDAAASIKDKGKQAYTWAKIKACQAKVQQQIDAANKTMLAQWKSDCESGASAVSFAHDHILSACMGQAKAHIERTLEKQGEKSEKSCLEAIDNAPGEWKTAMSDWASDKKNAIDTSLGGSIDDAIAKAKEEAADEQRKFSTFVKPLFGEGTMRAGVVAVAGAAAAGAAAAVAVAAVALRLRRGQLVANEADPMLAADVSGDAAA